MKQLENFCARRFEMVKLVKKGSIAAAAHIFNTSRLTCLQMT